MTRLARLHLIVGGLGLLAFLLSGQFMHHLLGHLHGMADGPRMLYRTAHIYLMWASLPNLLLGIYMQPVHTSRWRQNVQRLGSWMLLAAPVLVGISFLAESDTAALVRPFARLGIYLGFAGTLLHALSQRIGLAKAS